MAQLITCLLLLISSIHLPVVCTALPAANNASIVVERLLPQEGETSIGGAVVVVESFLEGCGVADSALEAKEIVDGREAATATTLACYHHRSSESPSDA